MGLLGSRKEKANAGKERRFFCLALEEEETSSHGRPEEELRSMATTTGKLSWMIGRD